PREPVEVGPLDARGFVDRRALRVEGAPQRGLDVLRPDQIETGEPGVGEQRIVADGIGGWVRHEGARPRICARLRGLVIMRSPAHERIRGRARIAGGPRTGRRPARPAPEASPRLPCAATGSVRLAGFCGASRPAVRDSPVSKRSAVKSYDLIVLGGGSGGLATAQRAAEYGAKVVLFEPARLGGTCVNVGCVPKKVMWNAAELAGAIANARYYGFDVSVAGHDWARLKQGRDAYVARLND